MHQDGWLFFNPAIFPATARTFRGAANQIQTLDRKAMAIAIQKAKL